MDGYYKNYQKNLNNNPYQLLTVYQGVISDLQGIAPSDEVFFEELKIAAENGFLFKKSGPVDKDYIESGRREQILNDEYLLVDPRFVSGSNTFDETSAYRVSKAGPDDVEHKIEKQAFESFVDFVETEKNPTPVKPKLGFFASLRNAFSFIFGKPTALKEYERELKVYNNEKYSILNEKFGFKHIQYKEDLLDESVAAEYVKGSSVEEAVSKVRVYSSNRNPNVSKAKEEVSEESLLINEDGKTNGIFVSDDNKYHNLNDDLIDDIINKLPEDKPEVVSEPEPKPHMSDDEIKRDVVLKVLDHYMDSEAAKNRGTDELTDVQKGVIALKEYLFDVDPEWNGKEAKNLAECLFNGYSYVKPSSVEPKVAAERAVKLENIIAKVGKKVDTVEGIENKRGMVVNAVKGPYKQPEQKPEEKADEYTILK